MGGLAQSLEFRHSCVSGHCFVSRNLSLEFRHCLASGVLASSGASAGWLSGSGLVLARLGCFPGGFLCLCNMSSVSCSVFTETVNCAFGLASGLGFASAAGSSQCSSGGESKRRMCAIANAKCTKTRRALSVHDHRVMATFDRQGQQSPQRI